MAKLPTPTRTLHNRGHRRIVGLLPSRKNGRGVAWESLLERDLYYYLEYRRDVVRYQCQPRRIDIWIDGRKATYTPDAEIVFDDGRIDYAEAKSAKAASKPKWKARQHAAAEALEAEGCQLHVFTEDDICPGHRAQNIRILYPYAHSFVLSDLHDSLWPNLSDSGSSAFRHTRRLPEGAFP